MQIVVDNGAYTLRNMGDVAMLQTAIRHLREIYPAADLLVLTFNPALLRQYCPGTIPVSACSRNAAYGAEGSASGRAKSLWRRLIGKSRPGAADPQAFRRVLSRADRIVVAGGGFLNDLNLEESLAVLRMLADAGAQGKPVALFSQGLGPLTDARLIKGLRDACSTGPWFGLRESRTGPGIVVRAEATPSRVAVTGDDAIEAAWRAESKPLGQALGVSMRQIAYAGTGAFQVELVSVGLRLLRSRLRAPVVALPISFNSFEDDAAVIARITGEAFEPGRVDDPSQLIAAASETRLVLTGTYHAAVFALAQGVPCICLAASQYYRDKFQGLATQFGAGCIIVDLSAEGAPEAIANEGERLWEEAAALRGVLRNRAATQVRAAHAFYEAALMA